MASRIVDVKHRVVSFNRVSDTKFKREVNALIEEVRRQAEDLSGRPFPKKLFKIAARRNEYLSPTGLVLSKDFSAEISITVDNVLRRSHAEVVVYLWYSRSFGVNYGLNWMDRLDWSRKWGAGEDLSAFVQEEVIDILIPYHIFRTTDEIYYDRLIDKNAYPSTWGMLDLEEVSDELFETFGEDKQGRVKKWASVGCFFAPIILALEEGGFSPKDFEGMADAQDLFANMYERDIKPRTIVREVTKYLNN